MFVNLLYILPMSITAITNEKLAVTSARFEKIRLVERILPDASGFLETASEALQDARPRVIPAPIAVNIAIAAAIAIILIHLLIR